MSISEVFVLAAACLGLATVIWLPRIIVPSSRSSRYDEILRVSQHRNSVRATVAQVVAGLAFVATFIQSSHNFDVDFRQRANQSSAELFAKTVSNLSTDMAQQWRTIGAFHALGAIRSDRRFERAINETLANFIVEFDVEGCDRFAVDKRTSIDLNGFNQPPLVKAAARVFADRDTSKDDMSRKYNLSKACLVRSDFLNSGGLSHIYIYEGSLDRSDVRYAFVDHSNLFETRARAVDFTGTSFEKSEMQGAIFTGSNFSHAKFVSSNLQGAYMQDVEFESATLENTNLAWADMRGAKNLTAEQLRLACSQNIVPHADTTSKERPPVQLDPPLLEKLNKLGGMKPCRTDNKGRLG